MGLWLPKVKMHEDLFDDFRLGHNRDDSHVVRTARTGQWVLLAHFINKQSSHFSARFFRMDCISDKDFTLY
jgi:hypothetical protein